MQIFQTMSIRRKQTLIIMLTSSAALLLACAAFVAYDTVTFRQELSQKVTILADAIGNNCAAAIDFNDPATAEDALAALRADGSIVSACVYSRDGQVFAVYQRDAASSFVPPAVKYASQEFTRDELRLFRVIKEGGSITGTIYVASDLKGLSSRLISYVNIVGMVFLASLLAALLLSSRLQRLVSDPILHLAQVARTVAQDKNYSLRAKKQSRDEIGQLVDGFNEMLAQIQRRDAALQGARGDLERRVEERTAELAESQSLYHSLVDQMPAGVFRKDAAGRYVFVNSWYCRIKGVKPDQILGRTPGEFTAWELSVQNAKDPEAVKKNQMAVQGANHHELIMETGRPIEVDEEHPGGDGKMLYLHVVKSPVFGHGGKIIGTQGMLFDVTERKQAEDELSYERGFLRTLLDNSPDPIYFKDAQSRFLKAGKAHAELFGLKSADEMAGRSDFDFFTEEHARPAFEDEQEIIRTGRPMIGRVEKEILKDGRVCWALTSKMPLRNKDGQIIGTFGISKDITVIKQVETELAYQRDLLGTLMNHSPDSIFFKDLQSRFVRVSRSEVDNLRRVSLSHYRALHPAGGEEPPPHLASAEEFGKFVIGKSDAEIYGPERAGEFGHDEEEIIRTGRPMIGKIERTVCPDGSTIWYITTKVAWRNKDGKIIGTFGTASDISDLKNAEAKLEQVHKQLLETSRQAGMAEVATNVLHNVGNVLNSVNVSASLVMDSVKKSKAASLAKVVAMLREHEENLGAFFTSDPRGRQLAEYLSRLSEHFLKDQQATVKELNSLRGNIEHIKEIVTMQQSYARVSGVKEIISISELVEDGLRMNEDALHHHQVEVIRDFEKVPPVNIDKHKVLQILLNLLRNAKHACQDSERADRRLTVRVSNGEGWIKISVTDNGVGIAPENLTRIFSHGFTTRKDGHGFGLHSGALAAQEMGGSLTAHSDGPGKGSTFTLELPVQPESTTRVLEM